MIGIGIAVSVKIWTIKISPFLSHMMNSLKKKHNVFFYHLTSQKFGLKSDQKVAVPIKTTGPK